MPPAAGSEIARTDPDRILDGLALANRGHDLRLIQDYLGHRDPRRTAHYTPVAGSRCEGIWT
jgi:hypothetical protein